jgi:putative membrane protein
LSARPKYFTHYLTVFLKGMAMGAADIVPGVSGGTIAFISGIYDRLISAIAACTPDKALWLARGRFRQTWEAIDGAFLFTLLAGIVTSIASLARLLTYLLEAHPERLWSFFFGLIVVSVLLVGRQIERWGLVTILAALAGAGFAYIITVAVPLQLPPTPLVIFLGASIAICAMILPGISGSFILLLLGLYAHVLAAVRSFDLTVIGVFVAGCVAGLLSFSRVLKWLLSHARNVTLAFLTGLLVGSLNKVWPWKETLSWRENSAGEQVPLVQANVGPGQFEMLTGQASHWPSAMALMLLGVVLVMFLEWWGRRP